MEVSAEVMTEWVHIGFYPELRCYTNSE